MSQIQRLVLYFVNSMYLILIGYQMYIHSEQSPARPMYILTNPDIISSIDNFVLRLCILYTGIEYYIEVLIYCFMCNVLLISHISKRIM